MFKSWQSPESNQLQKTQSWRTAKRIDIIVKILKRLNDLRRFFYGWQLRNIVEDYRILSVEFKYKKGGM